MASTSTRVGALALAVLFIATSVGVSLIIIYQMRHDDKQAASSTTTSTTCTALLTPKAGTPLQGTKLENFTPVEKIDTLQKIDTVPGTGAEVKAGDTVTAHYTGAVAATGVIFQSSHDSGQPATFPLTQVIAGWTQGVPGMKVCGTRRLLIPASLAYGANPPQGSGIPPNADLVFDIEMVETKTQ